MDIPHSKIAALNVVGKGLAYGHVRNVRAVVHGHMTLACMETLGNAYFIDTNGGGGAHGHFTFLELDTLKAWRGPGGELVKVSKRYR